jgi:hypothetical protein
MLLGGLWHGAAWTFVLWGLYQGALLILYRPFEPVFASAFAAQRQRGSFGEASRFAVWPAWVLMFHWTCYGWLIFRSPSLRGLGRLTRSLFFDFRPSTIDLTGILVPLLLYTTPLLVVHLAEWRADDVLVVPKARAWVRYTVYVATLYLIMLFGNFGGSDFIYFQF